MRWIPTNDFCTVISSCLFPLDKANGTHCSILFLWTTEIRILKITAKSEIFDKPIKITPMKRSLIPHETNISPIICSWDCENDSMPCWVECLLKKKFVVLYITPTLTVSANSLILIVSETFILSPLAKKTSLAIWTFNFEYLVFRFYTCMIQNSSSCKWSFL